AGFPFAPEPRGAERRQALARNAVPVARLAIGPISLAKRDHRPITPAGAPLGAPRAASLQSRAALLVAAIGLVRQPAPGSQLIVAGGGSPGPPESEGTSLGRGSRAADPAYRRVPAPRTLGPHLRPRILGPLHLQVVPRRRPSGSEAVGNIAHPRN